MSVKVSVILISYNQGEFIEETIKSILNQRYTAVEFILIDGGSTDNTMDIVRNYDDRFDIIIHEKDKGQTDAINKGFRLATGDIVGWINSDDILYPYCIEEVVKMYKENPDGAIYYSRVIDVIDMDSKKIGSYSKSIANRNYLLRQAYDVNQPGSFYSSRILKKVEYLDENINYCMDLDLWLKLLDYGSIYQCIEVPLAAIRTGGYTKTSTGGHAFLKEIRQTLLKYGASIFSPSVRKTYWLQLRLRVKSLLRLN